MFYFLDIVDSCSDYNFISILVILKRILSIVQLIVPIVLILSCIFGLIKLLINPDDKKGLVNMRNKVFAALICIFVPYIVNFTMMLTEGAFNVSACWKTAEEYKAQMDSADTYDVVTNKNNKKKVQKGEKDYTFNGYQGDNVGPGTGVTGRDVVLYALKFVGKKYVYGGGHGPNDNSLEEIYNRGGGVDCSAFVRLVYKHFGYNLSATTWSQVNDGRAVPYSQAQAGDLILYDGHVAIFMGDGAKIVHASNSLPFPRGGVKIGNNAAYKRIVAVRRILI